MKAQVLLPKIFDFPFTYKSVQNSLKAGDFVEVPFGKKKEIVCNYCNKKFIKKD